MLQSREQMATAQGMKGDNSKNDRQQGTGSEGNSTGDKKRSSEVTRRKGRA